MTRMLAVALVSLNLSGPTRAYFGQTISFKATWHSDTPAALWVSITPLTNAQHCSDRRSGMKGPVGDLAIINRIPTNDGTQDVDASRVTTAPAAYLVCGWIQAPGRPDSDPLAGPIERHLTVTTPALYRGKTSRHLGMSFATAGPNVLNMHFDIRFKCPRKVPQPLLEPVNFDTFKIGPGGRLRFDGQGGGQKVKMRGRIRGRRASGTFVGTLARQGGAVCRSGKLRWSAKRTK